MPRRTAAATTPTLPPQTHTTSAKRCVRRFFPHSLSLIQRQNITLLTPFGQLLGDAVQHIPRRVALGRHSSGADSSTSPNEPPTAYKTYGYSWAQRPPLSLFKEAYYGFPPATPVAALVRAGVLHAAELAYVFGDVYEWADATAGDVRVARLVQGM